MSQPLMTHEQVIDLAPGYVLGALDRAEEAAVRTHLATCLLAHDDFETLGGIVPALLELDDLVLVEPPASLGARIMAAAAADLAANPRVSAATASTASASSAASVPGGPLAGSAAVPPASTSAAPIAFPSAAARAERDTARERTRTSRLDWVLRVAAVLAIVAVGTWGLNLQSQLDAAQRFDRAVAAVVQTATQPGSLTVPLAAKDSKASGIAAVAPDGSVVMAVRDLPATTGSQVYEAWVIVGKTAPLAVGGFTVDAAGTALFRTIPATTPPGAVIALTLEPQAGNTVPQGSVVALGTASTPPASS